MTHPNDPYPELSEQVALLIRISKAMINTEQTETRLFTLLSISVAHFMRDSKSDVMKYINEVVRQFEPDQDIKPLLQRLDITGLYEENELRAEIDKFLAAP